jgi:hypothetical protein
VVDVDFTRVGDAMFDLTMLALGSSGVDAANGIRSRLFDRGLRELPVAPTYPRDGFHRVSPPQRAQGWLAMAPFIIQLSQPSMCWFIQSTI